MNDNYLWDKTGQPDAEVQELEELLGTLKYQPRPLQIPATASLRKGPFIPIAIAAAIALLMIGTGLWIRFANSRSAPTGQANRGTQSTREAQPATPAPQDSVAFAPRDHKINRPLSRTSFNQRRVVRSQPRLVTAKLTKEELAQKEQVLVALRLVSAKLNLAQRKTQSLPPPNTIRNQHKIG